MAEQLVTVSVRATPLGDPADVVPAAIERAFLGALLYLEREVKKATPIGVTEAARGSIAHQVEREGGSILGRLGSPIPYVQVLNDGRLPGSKMPPPEALELWVRRKIMIEVAKKRGEGTRRVSPTVDQAKGIAWAIARAIKARGTKPLRMFEGAVERGEGTLQGIFAEAGMRIVIDLTKKGSA